MLPKSYIVTKWIIYSLGTLLLFALQHLLLNPIRLLGVTPFLYPILPALVASHEGLRSGSVFALSLGVVCDLLLTGPFNGFYTIMFTLIGILAAVIGENLISSGFLCSFAVSVVALLLTSLAQILLLLLSGQTDLLLMGRIALMECALTLPAILPAHFIYSKIHRRCAVDY